MDILKEIKDNIIQVEPEAEVYLFGSRARNDYKEDSDRDLLILLPGEVNYPRKTEIIISLFKLESDYNIIFNRIIHSKDFWENNHVFKQSPFYENVQRDSVL
ncbi:MAG: nucleotidyltransferase domain-containing protein [Bacteroidetes bacterium]|nr:MAG: nucleotidyltransferase domain-containing protein [Bacteroidota bacterium]